MSLLQTMGWHPLDPLGLTWSDAPSEDHHPGKYKQTLDIKNRATKTAAPITSHTYTYNICTYIQYLLVLTFQCILKLSDTTWYLHRLILQMSCQTSTHFQPSSKNPRNWIFSLNILTVDPHYHRHGSSMNWWSCKRLSRGWMVNMHGNFRTRDI